MLMYYLKTVKYVATIFCVYLLTQLQQDWRCTYTVALRHVRVIIVAVEMQSALHILSTCVA